MVAARPQLALRRRRDRPGAARRRRAGGLRGEDPQRRRPAARPHEAVDPAKARPAAAAGRAVAARSTTCRPDEVRIDLVGGAAARARRRRWSSTCGGSADGRSRPPTPSRCTGAIGHLIDVQADVSPGHGRHRRWSAGPTRRSTRRATAAGWRSSTAGSTWPATRRVTILLSPGRPAQARHPLRPGDRRRRAGRRRRGRRRHALDGTVFIGELTLDRRAAVGARACCRW